MLLIVRVTDYNYYATDSSEMVWKRAVKWTKQAVTVSAVGVTLRRWIALDEQQASSLGPLNPWLWRQYVAPKRREQPTQRLLLLSHKNGTPSETVETPNLYVLEVLYRNARNCNFGTPCAIGLYIGSFGRLQTNLSSVCQQPIVCRIMKLPSVINHRTSVASSSAFILSSSCYNVGHLQVSIPIHSVQPTSTSS